jgi:hypothetical protein
MKMHVHAALIVRFCTLTFYDYVYVLKNGIH